MRWRLLFRKFLRKHRRTLRHGGKQHMIRTLLGNTIFALALLPAINQTADAGWYEVTNYTGTIGSYPIHLSLQKYDHFGGDTTLMGSYYYDKHMSPIPIYGKFNGSGQAELCETHTKAGCEFKLEFHGNDANGTWSSHGKKYAVTLKRVASLDDTGDHQQANGVVEIPFWGQTSQHMFVGTYESNQFGVSSIKVVNKRTGKVIQKLESELSDCGAGVTMTIIYENVKMSVNAHGKIEIACSGKFSQPLLYSFKRATGKFESAM